ncbi:MAG TPA: TraR/DksA C4-type zinc finger protein [Jatrophihabitantaceae bacterium]|nr:TraR/DksA C4-type zinc finger protein [Jatrophihabitantaceae bacterium]
MPFTQRGGDGMAAVGRIGRALRRRATAGAATKAAPAKKSAAKKSAAKKAAPAKKSAAKKAAPTKKSTAKKAAPAKKRVAKKAAPAKQTVAKKAAPAKQTVTKKAPPAKKAVATTADPAKAAATTAPKPAANGAGANISVPKGSEWTKAELAAVRRDLVSQLDEMRAAYDTSLRDLNDLQQSGTDGAGDDQADAGSKTFEREQEQSIAANRMDLIVQIQRAVERIDAGTYGFCESCGRPIPKARLKAFPMATLDVACKQREERR